MTLTSLLKNKHCQKIAILSLLLFSVTTTVAAQSSLVLSVSPTLFEMSAVPGQTWNTTLRVINTNARPLDLELTVANFVPRDEGGAVRFELLTEDDIAANDSLAAWISLGQQTLTVPPEQTLEVPISITLPENAAPGGHYASVMVGTRQYGSSTSQSGVETNQVVTSLFFLRVGGQVTEQAQVRSFVADGRFQDKPMADFELRVQNTGNVFIQPQGTIRIYNMWGQERGVIPVNKRSLFGKVVQESTRKYEFSWAGEWSLADFGRYKAEASLTYGDAGRKSMYAETTFWIIPWKALLLVIGFVVGMLWLIAALVRAYVRRMLVLAGVDPAVARKSPVRIKRAPVTVPIERGMLDLRARLQASHTVKERLKTLLDLGIQHKKVLGAIILLLSGLWLFVLLVFDANDTDRSYEVTVGTGDNAVQLSTDELTKDSSGNIPQVSNGVTVSIINRSGVPGLEEQIAQQLIAAGYTVLESTIDEVAAEAKTIVIYNPEDAQIALSLSQELDGALLSAFTEEGRDGSVLTVYLGQDQVR